MENKLFLIDGHALIFKMYYAFQQSRFRVFNYMIFSFGLVRGSFF